MILSSDMVRAIAAGRKTVHRRPIIGDHPCPLTRGRTVAVQPGRGRPAQLRVTITETRWELLGAITFADACAEGFRGTDPFKAKWVTVHDKHWLTRQDNPDETLLLQRFETRHADRPVWVIEFKLSREDTPRLLGSTSPLTAGGKARLLSPHKRKPGRARLPEVAMTADQAAGYVVNQARSLRGEPEAVSESEQAWITAQAGMTSRQWQAREALHAEAEARDRSFEERVLAARRAASVDVSLEVFKVRQIMAAGRVEVAEHWLQKLERKAYAPALRRAA